MVCTVNRFKRKLLSESDLNLNKAIQVAIAMETVAHNTVELQAKHQNLSGNKLESHNLGDGWQGKDVTCP